jgi:hypothetical protein
MADRFTKDWLRSIGFKDKRYQGETQLALHISKGHTGDSQWIELEDETNGVFALRRWSPMYDNSMPPDYVGIEVASPDELLILLRLLGAKLSTGN